MGLKTGTWEVMLTKVLCTACIGYLLYCGLVFLAQRPMMFPSWSIRTPPRPDLSAYNAELLEIPCGSGAVEAWYFPPEDKKKNVPVLIYAHGNGELIDDNIEEARYFTGRGAGVLLVEYPGYGRSSGRPGRKSIKEAFTAAYDIIAQRPETDASRIVFFGRSLGGAAVCELSRSRQAAAIILMCTFTDVSSLVKKYLVPGWLVRDRFDNLGAVSDFPGPVLVIHGKQDETISWKHGRKLYESAENARMVSYDCGHNDFPPSFREEIVSFLKPKLNGFKFLKLRMT